MFFLRLILLVISLLYLSSCNRNKSDEEMKELWSKAQTTGEIINRSGTKFNSGTNKKLALSDAQNRLMSGGGLFKDGISFGETFNNEKNNPQVSTVGMSINPFLWKGALET
jgi:hypothetical protein